MTISLSSPFSSTQMTGVDMYVKLLYSLPGILLLIAPRLGEKDIIMRLMGHRYIAKGTRSGLNES